MFFIDNTFATKHTPAKGIKCCQVFASYKGHISVFPMKSQNEFDNASRWFCKEVVVSGDLILDRFSTHAKKSIKWFCDQVSNALKILEHTNPWENHAELCIRLLKETKRKDMR